MTAIHLAVLDDEPDITELLAAYLTSHGFRVSQCHSGRALLALVAASDTPALVLLDLGLPGEDGLAIARELRNVTPTPGVIIVSGRGDAVDKVVGLEIGADDYVTKPFDLRELLARIKAVLRRLAVASTGPAAATGGSETLVFCGWRLERNARRLLGPGEREVVLTAGEFDLLVVLLEHPGRVLSRDFLLEHTRGREAAPFDRTIDVQIGRLRRKIEADPQQPQILKSVRSAGYLLAVPVSSA